MKFKLILLLVLLLLPLCLGSFQKAETLPPITMEYIKPITSTTTATTTPRIRSNLGLEQLIRKEFKQSPEMIKIAWCESKFRQFDPLTGKVLRGEINPNDVGIFQINERYHLKKSLRMGLNIHSVEGNIAYAKHLYKKEGITPWGASGNCQEK